MTVRPRVPATCCTGCHRRRRRRSPTSCAARPPAGCCCWLPRSWRSSGRTLRGPTPTTSLGVPWSAVPGIVELDLEHWASEGLLAVFFLVAGLELKREFVVGDLSDRREAVLPVVAAFAGMLVPAVFYLLVNLGADGRPGGWAVPVATDIAFALAVLALVGDRLPTALRAFLLSLAVVDDLLAILDHRRGVHRARCGSQHWAARSRCSARMPCSRTAGSGRGGCTFRSDLRSGCSCTRRGCMRQSPASRSGC